MPHVVASVSRTQGPGSGLVALAQAPDMQVRSVRVRVRVPLSSQVSEYIPQAPHAPKVVLPQLVPSVGRVHASDAMEGLALQTPDAHAYDVMVLVRVPLVAHVSA